MNRVFREADGRYLPASAGSTRPKGPSRAPQVRDMRGRKVVNRQELPPVDAARPDATVDRAAVGISEAVLAGHGARLEHLSPPSTSVRPENPDRDGDGDAGPRGFERL